MRLILPVFALIAIGAGLRRVRWLTAEADASLLKLIVNFFYPCLVLDTVLGNEALREPANLLLPPLVGFGTMAAGIGIAYYAGRALGLTQGQGLRTFAFGVGLYNYGYIPLPLMAGLFGPESVGVLLVHNVGCEMAIWTVGLLVLSGLSLREGWRRLINPPLVALGVAVIGNVTGAGAQVPEAVMGLVRLCAACAIPLGLLLIGATLEGYVGRPRELFSPKVSLAAVALRLGLLPPLFLLLAWVLPASVELKRVILVQAAMPAGVLPIVIAKHYGGQPLTAVRVVVATTAVALVAIPWWLRVGLGWVTE